MYMYLFIRYTVQWVKVRFRVMAGIIDGIITYVNTTYVRKDSISLDMTCTMFSQFLSA